MKGKAHSPEQIVSKLREVDRMQAEEGLSIAAAAKRVEVAEWTVYRWRRQYAGMSRDDAKRLIGVVAGRPAEHLVCWGVVLG